MTDVSAINPSRPRNCAQNTRLYVCDIDKELVSTMVNLGGFFWSSFTDRLVTILTRGKLVSINKLAFLIDR